MAGRRVTASITLTLDGRTTGAGGPYDMGPIAPHGVTDQAREAMEAMTSATLVLLGRRNYEGFGGWWPQVAADPSADPRDRAFSRWLDEVEKVVFSRTLDEPLAWQNARLAEADPVTTVRSLRGSGAGEIRVLASASIIRALLAADELDRLELTLSPEVVDGGATLFGDEPVGRSSWRPVAVTPTDSGAVRLTYDRIGAGA